jgi:pSer/pThr/pTyr-binding forkhead associated (FHA) protein
MASLVFYLDKDTSMTHVLESGTTTLGRHPDSVIVLDCQSVSSHHALIELQKDGCYISDQQSSNGTRINGAVIEEAKLTEGDRVAFGDIQAVFYAGSAPSDEPEEIAVAKPVMFVPPPVLPVKDAPPPPAPADYRKKPTRPPAPADYRKKPTRPPGVRRASNYPDQTGSGCSTALIVIFLFIAAFVAGLFLRHSKETEGGNFFSDVANKISGTIPKIKVEK